MTRLRLAAAASGLALLAACGGAPDDEPDTDAPEPGMSDTDASEGGAPDGARDHYGPVLDPEKVDPVRGVTARDFVGDWSGALDVMGQALPLVLHVSHSDALSVTLDSPAQGAFGLEGAAAVEDGMLVARWSQLGVTYTARLSQDGHALSGPFSQNGRELRLRMTRTDAPAVSPDRPQAVIGTPDYRQVTGSAESVPGVRLAYTLTLPDGDGPVPGVVIVSGSGPQDRDETLMGHKPFAVLADSLTRAGIAVLRFDDRGVARSGGTFAGATSRDFADDAAAMLTELSRVAGAQDVSLSSTGFIGHSEGALVAALAAAEAGADPDFVVSLAGPFVPMGDVLIRQTEDLLRLQGAAPDQINAAVRAQTRLVRAAETGTTPDAACAAVETAGRDLPTSARDRAKELCAPWFFALLRLDPADLYARVDAPVLALMGARDQQVAADANAEAAERLTGVEVAVIPEVNHLFQTAETGAVSEYGAIEETMAPAAIDRVATWIRDRD